MFIKNIAQIVNDPGSHRTAYLNHVSENKSIEHIFISFNFLIVHVDPSMLSGTDSSLPLSSPRRMMDTIHNTIDSIHNTMDSIHNTKWLCLPIF